MPARKAMTDAALVVAAFIALVALVDGGAGWAATSTRVVLAVRGDHAASAPLYDLVAGAAALLPFGEPGFRLGLLGAVLGAITVAGIVTAARALLPKEPSAGYIAGLLVLLAPPVREALATPQIMAACGAVWAIACAARHARSKSSRDAACALASIAVVIGSAPWLGALLFVVIAGWLLRDRAAPQLVALAAVALGAGTIVLWWNALGSVPAIRASLADAIGATGRGAGAIVVGAGLLGIAFGALTALPSSRWLAVAVATIAAHEILVGSSSVALIAAFAIGTAIVAAALARVISSTSDGWKRDAIVVACGAPLLIAAFAVGVSADLPGDSPARLAHDLAGSLPPGPGLFVATRPASWFALQHERVVAGMRGDLTLVPPLPGERADVLVADALRAHQVVGADAASFGRLDVQRALPIGRGFQLVGALVPAVPVEPPAHYATATGAEQALLLALDRARIEAANGRLDLAARAAGLTDRFRAADLAVLAATIPTKARPALFGFLPASAPGPWLVDVFGDDLAWVAGLPIPALPPDAPMPRRLHELWRQILAGTAKADAAAALGPVAVDATTTMLKELGR